MIHQPYPRVEYRPEHRHGDWDTSISIHTSAGETCVSLVYAEALRDALTLAITQAQGHPCSEGTTCSGKDLSRQRCVGGQAK
jgi:hypothetical protein